MRKTAVIAIAALLSGCEIAPVQSNPTPAAAPTESLTERNTRLLNAGLGKLSGQNIQAAASVLGYPTGQRQVIGDTVYSWYFEEVLPGFGYVPPAKIYCLIEIGTDPSGTIKNSRYDGNAGGCARFANALTPR